MKIGEFSKLSRVSVRMLRHYDDIGLLKPVEIDHFTGYRYYEASQLKIVWRITALKAMGFSLADIVRMLECYDDKEKMGAFLARRKVELLELSEQTARQLMLLDAAQIELRKEESMTYDVTIKTIPERYAATLKTTIPHYEDEALMWQMFCEETDPLNMVEADPCLVAVSYLDSEYKEENVELMAWKTVKGNYQNTEHVVFQTLPEVKVASCVFNGGYEQTSDCYAAVMAWMEQNGYECAGPVFNIYHVSPHETSNPDEFVTEACYPIA